MLRQGVFTTSFDDLKSSRKAAYALDCRSFESLVWLLAECRAYRLQLLICQTGYYPDGYQRQVLVKIVQGRGCELDWLLSQRCRSSMGFSYPVAAAAPCKQLQRLHLPVNVSKVLHQRMEGYTPDGYC